MTVKPVEVTIIGAGVLGAATAYTLTKKFGNRVIVTVLEQHALPALETSGRNSGVLHSGIHEPAGSLKARFAFEGHTLAKQFAETHGIPLLPCGMLIVASQKDLFKIVRQGKSFLKICKNGKAQGIEMQILASWEIQSLEPRIEGVGGMYIPSVAVIDSTAFVNTLIKEAEKRGAATECNAKVVRITRRGEKLFVETTQSIKEADVVLNMAGLYADEIAARAGFSDYSITPYRGEYYEVIGKEREYVNRLVYPVPIEGQVGKGIHLLKRPDGRLFIGPNARQVPAKDYYEEDKTPPDVFRNVAVRFCPDLRNAELRWAYSGIRPKIIANSRKNESSDFLIHAATFHHPLFISAIGYESPGLSGAMAAAKYVTDIVRFCYLRLS